MTTVRYQPKLVVATTTGLAPQSGSRNKAIFRNNFKWTWRTIYLTRKNLLPNIQITLKGPPNLSRLQQRLPQPRFPRRLSPPGHPRKHQRFPKNLPPPRPPRKLLPPKRFQRMLLSLIFWIWTGSTLQPLNPVIHRLSPLTIAITGRNAVASATAVLVLLHFMTLPWKTIKRRSFDGASVVRSGPSMILRVIFQAPVPTALALVALAPIWTPAGTQLLSPLPPPHLHHPMSTPAIAINSLKRWVSRRIRRERRTGRRRSWLGKRINIKSRWKKLNVSWQHPSTKLVQLDVTNQRETKISSLGWTLIALTWWSNWCLPCWSFGVWRGRVSYFGCAICQER